MRGTVFPYRFVLLAGLALMPVGLALREPAVWVVGLAAALIGAAGTRRTRG
jgi:hypothetical protein